MKNKKRILSAILAAVMLIGSLASCGNQPESTETGSSDVTRSIGSELRPN